MARDDHMGRLTALRTVDAPLDLISQPVTSKFADKPSPVDDWQYKHREDFVDATLYAWTGLLSLAYGLKRCQVLGIGDLGTPVGTIIAPTCPEQRYPAIPDG